MQVKRKESLIRKFIWMFIGFVLIAMVLNTSFAYFNQKNDTIDTVVASLENTGAYIGELMKADGPQLQAFKEYYIDHYTEIRVPMDFDGDSSAALANFDSAMLEKHPGKVLFNNISFSELDSETQLIWAKYMTEKWLNIFEKARDANELDYVYFVYAVSNDEMQYMIDGVRLEDENNPGNISLGYTGVIERESHENMWKTWETRELTGDLDITKNEFGNVYTYYYPVIYGDTYLGMVCAEANIDVTQGLIQSSVWKQSLIFFAVLIISSFLILAFISSSVLRRISQLDENIQVYAETKNPEISAIVKKYVVKNNDEISTLGSNFSDMTSELEDYMVNLQIVTAENEKIGAELGVATEIQHSMLPQQSYDDERFDIFAKMDAAKAVGGDFYDYFMVDKDHMAIVIADVSGKGVPAALFMVIAKAMLKNNVMRELPVDEIFTLTNDQLGENNSNELFVTTWLGIIDLNTGVMDFVEAGHENPIIIHKDGSIKEVAPAKKKMPLAAWEGMKYIPNQIQLKEDDTIVLYTDGVPEATDAENNLYGMDKLRDLLKNCNNMSPEKILRAIREDVDGFVGDAPQFDDLTMLAFKWKKK